MAGPRTKTIIAGFFAGLVVLLLLFPAHGIDPIPPVCFSVVGYAVPCDAWVAWAAGAVAAGLVGLGSWRLARARGGSVPR